jgi:hypothetical protein
LPYEAAIVVEALVERKRGREEERKKLESFIVQTRQRNTFFSASSS